MLGIFAEFETAIRRGRKATIDPEAITALVAEGLGPSEIAKQMGIARISVYRALASAASQRALGLRRGIEQRNLLASARPGKKTDRQPERRKGRGSAAKWFFGRKFEP